MNSIKHLKNKSNQLYPDSSGKLKRQKTDTKSRKQHTDILYEHHTHTKKSLISCQVNNTKSIQRSPVPFSQRRRLEPWLHPKEKKSKETQKINNSSRIQVRWGHRVRHCPRDWKIGNHRLLASTSGNWLGNRCAGWKSWKINEELLEPHRGQVWELKKKTRKTHLKGPTNLWILLLVHQVLIVNLRENFLPASCRKGEIRFKIY